MSSRDARYPPPMAWLAVALLLTVAACTRGGAIDDPPTTTLEAATTTIDTNGTTTTAPAEGEDLVFGASDTGVAIEVRQLDVEEFSGLDLEPIQQAESGATFTTTSCVTTWPNRWEIHASWQPAAGASPDPTEWVIAVALDGGDVIGGDASAIVTLDGPGSFVIPLKSDPENPRWRRATELSAEHRADRVFGREPRCGLVVVGGPQPIVEQMTNFVETTAAFTPPISRHSEGTLQAELESMTSPDTYWLRTLAWYIGIADRPPFDVMYVRPGEEIAWLDIREEGTCVEVELSYSDGARVHQAGGCPPYSSDGAPPSGYDTVAALGNGWIVATADVDIHDLAPMPWLGGPAPPLEFDAEAAAAALPLPEGHQLVATFPFSDGLVALIRQDDPPSYYTEELFSGGGGGYVGGGPGETWQGCWRVDYSDAGYAIIIVADPSWKVRYGSSELEVVPAGDVGASILEGHFDRPPTVHVSTDPGSNCS